jgi:hypothetical protein
MVGGQSPGKTASPKNIGSSAMVAYKTSGEAYGQYTADKSTYFYNIQTEITLISFTRRQATSFAKQGFVAGGAVAVAA